jgi:hypothetical protein
VEQLVRDRVGKERKIVEKTLMLRKTLIREIKEQNTEIINGSPPSDCGDAIAVVVLLRRPKY